MAKVSTNEFSQTNEKTYSCFGTYDLQDDLILNLPNNIITLRNLGGGKFSYIRNSQNETIKKIIQATQNVHKIELAPALPIRMPSYKTDFFFLRFEDPLFIAENSTMETLVSFPIEIGLFLVGQGRSSGFDFFSCDPSNSRFGLYGTPEDGRLCKYATASLDCKRIVMQPFINTHLKIEIVNELNESASVGKVVFPVTDHDLYYDDGEVRMDGLQAIIKNRVGLHVMETVQNPITKPANWILASRDTEKTDYKFSMEQGFD